MLRRTRSFRPIPALVVVAGALLLASLACNGLNTGGATATAVPPTLAPAPTQAPPPTQAPLPTVPLPQPSGGQVSLTLINQTADSICYVYISPVTSQYWGDDWLGSDIISGSSQYTFAVPAGAYDLRAEFCGTSDSVEERQVDLTADSTWTISPSQAPATQVSGTGGLDFTLDPNYGAATISSGFVPDPQTVSITSGGPVDVSTLGLGSGCGGYATSSPDFEVTYTSGGFSLLRFYFVSTTGDTTLIINGPNGAWYCVDDSFGTLNPTIDFQNPSSGVYDVWVGSYSSDTFATGTLYITELDSNHP
jgi:hypothetical protein